MNESNLHVYQKFCVEHLVKHPAAGIMLEMGLGKTITVLTGVARLKAMGEVKKVLIVAPKKVAESVWHVEGDKWEHVRDITFSLVTGTEPQRKKAMNNKADVYVIGRDNIAWLVAQYGLGFPFDMVVIDESSSFKNQQSRRFKALRMIRPKVKRVVILTGTPIPNGLLDLWPQVYLLDQGERLGKTITGYRNTYFKPGRGKGHVVFEYHLQNSPDEDIFGANYYEKEIYDKISDICISMKKEDWLSLPPRIDIVSEIVLPTAIQQKYNAFEKEKVLELADTPDITALNAAALSMKLRQFANGAVYNPDGTYFEVHNEKIEALGEKLEAMNGKPYLLFYQFRSDLERIQKHLKEFKPHALGGPGDIVRWNRKEIPFMLAHGASAGHGLNLQAGGHHLGWFGIDFNLEVYQQAIARLERQGQAETVFNDRLLTKGSIEERILQVLEGKADKQEGMMQAIKALIKKHTT